MDSRRSLPAIGGGDDGKKCHEINSDSSVAENLPGQGFIRVWRTVRSCLTIRMHNAP